MSPDPMPFRGDASYAAELDSQDVLSGFREQFLIPLRDDGSPSVYLCGNSLGLQPIRAREYINTELDDWALLGVEGHFRAQNPWMAYHELLSAPTAALVGATASEVVVMNTLTVNLHLMMVSFYRPTASRYKILIEHKAFPSDQYAVASQLRHHGISPEEGLVEVYPDEQGQFRTEDILARIDDEKDSLALIMLGGVNYYNGQLLDLGSIAAHARHHGITVGYDLAHAAGNVPLALHDWGVDFAVWCSYKYLNAGPGSTAGCFVHERHEAGGLNRFAGWGGHDKHSRFRMGPEFMPMHGAEGWQLSNPSILPLATLRASMDLFEAAGMDRLRRKSVALTGYLHHLLQQHQTDEWRILTPDVPSQRGCQLSLQFRSNGRQVFDTLTREGVVCDWREPDVIRVAPVPLYNTFTDVYRFAAIVRDAVSTIPGN